MHRACVKIGFEMMLTLSINYIRFVTSSFLTKKSCEMMFGDIHEHNTKQSSLGHKISFFSSFFFLSRQALKWCFLIEELSRARSARSGVPWIIKSNYLCIQEILVLTKSSVRLTYRTYIHYTSTPLTWITEKELEQEIKEKYENFIAALENEKCYSSHQGKNERQWKKEWTGAHSTFPP